MALPRLTLQSLNLPDVNDKFNAIEGIELADWPGEIEDDVIDYAVQDANVVFAGPSSGADASPTFRALVAADIPNLAASKITTGQLALARGGTNADLSATGGTNQLLKQASAGAAITVGTIATTNLSDVTDVTDVTFDAANFTADSGDWTLAAGDQTTFAYAIHGKMMTVWFYLNATTVSATPSQLRITIPASKTAAKTLIHGGLLLSDNAAASALGFMSLSASGTTIVLQKISGNWSAATDATLVTGFISFPIQ